MNAAERRRITRALIDAGFRMLERTRHTELWYRAAPSGMGVGLTFRMPANRGTHDPRNADEQLKALRALGVKV